MGFFVLVPEDVAVAVVVVVPAVLMFVVGESLSSMPANMASRSSFVGSFLVDMLVVGGRGVVVEVYI